MSKAARNDEPGVLERVQARLMRGEEREWFDRTLEQKHYLARARITE